VCLQLCESQEQLAESKRQAQLATSQLQQQTKDIQAAQAKAEIQKQKLSQCQARLKAHIQLEADHKRANEVWLPDSLQEVTIRSAERSCNESDSCCNRAFNQCRNTFNQASLTGNRLQIILELREELKLLKKRFALEAIVHHASTSASSAISSTECSTQVTSDLFETLTGACSNVLETQPKCTDQSSCCPTRLDRAQMEKESIEDKASPLKLENAAQLRVSASRNDASTNGLVESIQMINPTGPTDTLNGSQGVEQKIQNGTELNSAHDHEASEPDHANSVDQMCQVGAGDLWPLPAASSTDQQPALAATESQDCSCQTEPQANLESFIDLQVHHS
jgi:hypothetical protein